MTKYKTMLNSVLTQLKKAWRILWKVLSFSLADPVFSFAKTVGISLEQDGVYLVYAEKVLSSMNIRHFRHYPLQENRVISPEYVAASVSGFIKEFKITNASFVMGLPRSWAIVQNVDFPSAAKENMDRVIAFEMDRLTPLNRNNACYDYAVLDQDAQNVKVLLAVVRADQVKAYLDALKARNIEVKKIGLNIFMLRHLVKETYPNTNMVLLSVSEDGSCESCVIVNSCMTHSVAGHVNLNDPASLETVAGQIHAMTDELVKKSNPPRIIVNADENIYCILRDQFKTLTVSHLNKDIKLPVSKQNKELSVTAIGGALDLFGRQADVMNLLPEKKRETLRTPWPLTAVLLTTIIAVGAFRLIAPLYFEQQKLDLMEQKLKVLKPDVKKVEVLKEEIETINRDMEAINAFKKQNDLTMNIIRDMTNILPAKTWLTRLRITDANAEIEGYSTSATEIILKLENTKHFQKVEFVSPTFRDPRLNTERFVIKMDLKSASGKKEQKKEMKNEKK